MGEGSDFHRERARTRRAVAALMAAAAAQVEREVHAEGIPPWAEADTAVRENVTKVVGLTGATEPEVRKHVDRMASAAWARFADIDRMHGEG